jgi:hypothetical protein
LDLRLEALVFCDVYLSDDLPFLHRHLQRTVPPAAQAQIGGDNPVDFIRQVMNTSWGWSSAWLGSYTAAGRRWPGVYGYPRLSALVDFFSLNAVAPAPGVLCLFATVFPSDRGAAAASEWVHFDHLGPVRKHRGGVETRMASTARRISLAGLTQRFVPPDLFSRRLGVFRQAALGIPFLQSWSVSKTPPDDRGWQDVLFGMGAEPWQRIDFATGRLYSRDAYRAEASYHNLARHTHILIRSKMRPIPDLYQKDMRSYIHGTTEDLVRDAMPWYLLGQASKRLAEDATALRVRLELVGTRPFPKRLRPHVVALAKAQYRLSRLARVDDESWRDADLPEGKSTIFDRASEPYPADKHRTNLHRYFQSWNEEAAADLALSRGLAESLLQLRNTRMQLILSVIAVVASVTALALAVTRH